MTNEQLVAAWDRWLLNRREDECDTWSAFKAAWEARTAHEPIERTKRLQAEHERDCAVEKLAPLRTILEQCEDLLRDRSLYLKFCGTPKYHELLGVLEALPSAPDEPKADLTDSDIAEEIARQAFEPRCDHDWWRMKDDEDKCMKCDARRAVNRKGDV